MVNRNVQLANKGLDAHERGNEGLDAHERGDEETQRRRMDPGIEVYELGELIGVDDAFLLAPVHVVGRGAASRLEINSVFGWLYEWRKGCSVRFRVCTIVEDALEAARTPTEAG